MSSRVILDLLIVLLSVVPVRRRDTVYEYEYRFDVSLVVFTQLLLVLQ